MAQGEISPNNIRMSLVIPRELKAQLEIIAKAESRSLNNYITKVLKEAVEEYKSRES